MFIRKLFSFATLTLIVALSLSAIAAWYSILGLTAIFAAAVIPIIIMGGSLEVAKVVTTIWLHKYWHRATWKLKAYLIPAVVALAFLTSMGIFGFLSKAHSDQTLVSGDTAAKVELVDEKIKISRENIAMNQKALAQMNSQVDQLLGRTDDDKGANRAIQVRRQQAEERNRLTQEIEAEQNKIAQLNEEVAPIRAEIRKIEAEVGPIKYIAALIYGDNPGTDLLERAVRWMIILIVFVFDPLALVLVLAAQSSYKWLDEDLQNDREKKNETNIKETPEITKPIDDGVISVGRGEVATNEPEEIIEDVTEDLQPDNVELHDLAREDIYEAPITDAASPGSSVGQEEARNIVSAEPTSQVIKTDGVTLHETDGGYIQFEGESFSKAALKGLRPELFLQVDSNDRTSTNFGTEFPRLSKKGDTFVRIDSLPNRVFKFNGVKWMEINKDQSSTYLYDEEYVKYLVNKIEVGEYDVDLLTDDEKLQIEDFLLQNKNSK
jgi:hypothetical protein